MTWHRWALALVSAAAVIAASACGSGSSDVSDWGAYPADTSLDERGAVKAYVEALDDRDGARFCAVVAPWISGRFDIIGTDPDASFIRPLRCPQFVSGFIGYIEDCCPPKFVGVEIGRMGELRRQADIVGVPITIRLHLDQDGRPITESRDDVVWVTKDSGAWRVAKLSEVAAAASIGLPSDEDLIAAPDVDAERRAYAAEVAAARGSPSPPVTVAVAGSSLPRAIYTVDGPFTVGGQPAHVSDNNVYSVIYRDLLSGFAAGYMGGRYGNGSANWVGKPPFAAARATSTPYTTYNEYAAVIYKYSNAYGFSFSDTLPKKVQLPLDGAATLRITILPDS